MKALSLAVFLCLLLTGCHNPETPMTPEQQEAQQERMREFLDESSPRNRNQQPKAVPEIVKNYEIKRTSKTVEESE